MALPVKGGDGQDYTIKSVLDGVDHVFYHHVLSSVLPTNAATQATLAALETLLAAGLPAALGDNGGVKVSLVDGLDAANDTVTAVGTAAHDAAVSGNPLLAAAEARLARRAAVAEGDVARLVADAYGRLLVRRPKTDQASDNGTAISSAAAGNITGPGTAGAMVDAPGAGLALKIYRLHAVNSGGTACVLYWRAGSTGNRVYPMYLAASGGQASIHLDGDWELAANTALFAYTSASGATVHFHVDNEKVAA